MTLRAQYDRAYSAWLATKSHRWAAEVSRLNLKIMQRDSRVGVLSAKTPKDPSRPAARLS